MKRKIAENTKKCVLFYPLDLFMDVTNVSFVTFPFLSAMAFNGSMFTDCFIAVAEQV
jgi:hypothetical protein